MRKNQRFRAIKASRDNPVNSCCGSGQGIPPRADSKFPFHSIEPDQPGCARTGCKILPVLLLLTLFFPSIAAAFWTGISARLANFDSDWAFESGTREAQLGELSFQIEERTGSNLAVGAEIGYFDLRVIPPSDSPLETLKFDGQYLGIYLRQPLRLNDWLTLHGSLGLRYSTGGESGSSDDDEAEIDWTSTLFELGLSLRYSNFRVTPYLVLHDIDGDISDDGTEVFEMEEDASQGIRIDYFVEDTAFIQFDFTTGGSVGGYINFVRRY